MPQPTKAHHSMEDAFLLFAVENLEQVKTKFQQDHERSSMLLQIHNELRRLWNQASEQVKNDYLTILLMGQQKNTAIHDSPIVDHNNEHVFDDDNIHVGQEKKRKIENVKPLVTTLLCDDVLKQILFFLDAPDFVNSQPWLVCKQWNQIFFKKGPGFAKLYCHSYFKLDEDQKNSLHQMLLENMFPYRAVFSTLLDCFKFQTLTEHDLQKLPKFAVIRMPSKPKKVVTILNENLFRHVMVINHQVEHLQGKESTLCTMTTYCFAFLSNGYPLIVTIECKHEKLNIEVGDDAIGSLRSKTTIY
ncbi:hypothetical protein C9374_003507 [Naegleria lovaniensis]|uniref:F-box domain-containing protein n=1 Tax=Naegleria lovaniensis TaxID=51637 RepID=A0AA88KPS4_NAELO|nr:uncharacterized protein C9374_003507 [Naegleria lovaniensis]KAG2385692.1 hypothetical protein C9374_003507 [Naegleria lovaniensis]